MFNSIGSLSLNSNSTIPKDITLVKYNMFLWTNMVSQFSTKDNRDNNITVIKLIPSIHNKGAHILRLVFKDLKEECRWQGSILSKEVCRWQDSIPNKEACRWLDNTLNKECIQLNSSRPPTINIKSISRLLSSPCISNTPDRCLLNNSTSPHNTCRTQASHKESLNPILAWVIPPARALSRDSLPLAEVLLVNNSQTLSLQMLASHKASNNADLKFYSH